MDMNKRNAHDTLLNAGLIVSEFVVLLVALLAGPAGEVVKVVHSIAA